MDPSIGFTARIVWRACLRFGSIISPLRLDARSRRAGHRGAESPKNIVNAAARKRPASGGALHGPAGISIAPALDRAAAVIMPVPCG